MCNVARHDNCTFQTHTGRDRIFGKFGTHSIDALVQVDFYALRTFAWLAVFFRNEFAWVGVHLLQPNTVFVDFALYVAVGRARYAHTDRHAGTMTWQTNDANVVCKILATELRTESNLMCFLENLLFQLDVAERTTCFVACCRERIVIFDAAKLDCEQILLG